MIKPWVKLVLTSSIDYLLSPVTMIKPWAKLVLSNTIDYLLSPSL